VRGPPQRGLSAALAVALGLHGLGLAVVALLGQPLSQSVVAPPAPPPSEAPLIWFERGEEPSPVESGVTETGAGQSEPSGPAARQPVARAVRPRRSAAAQGKASAAAGAEAADSSIETIGELEASGEEAALAAPAAAARADRSLSLDALGVGQGHNPFFAPSAQKAPHAIFAPSARKLSARALGQRIDHVLRSGLAEHDRQLGLGPEGPVVAAVTDLVMQSTTAPNTDALLLVRTDGSGETVHVEVLEASGDRGAWNAVARSLAQALHGKKLRVPSGSGGVTMQLQVVSREQLPSGRDPGLAIDLLGQQIKAGAGPKSTRLQLLTPKIVLEQYQISSTDPHVKIPVIGLSLNIFGVQGDPVDIAAVARRVVHAHLVSMETHPRDPD